MKISETVEFLHEVGGVMIRLTLQQVGRDLLVLLTGGDAPHVGSVIAAAPRVSEESGCPLRATSSTEADITTKCRVVVSPSVWRLLSMHT